MTDKANITILNVDDDDAGRYAVSRILLQEGFHIVEAANGAEALRLVKNKPDLVILDVDLPDMSGFEVCQRIKADPSTSLIPVLHLSTTYLDSESRVKGLERGADGYLMHPAEPEVLVAYVKTLLRARQAEGKLLAAAQQWRSTFDAISDSVCLLDRDGEVLRCNRAMADILGKAFSEIIGRTCWEVVHGTSEPIEGCPFVRTRETGRRETLVLPWSDRWFEVAVHPLLNEAGAFTGAVHIMIDITQRKLAQEALQEAHDEMEKRVEERTTELSRANALLKREIAERLRVEEELRKINEELKNFVHIVSHDLKIPIISIQGFSRRLLKNCQEELGEKGRRYLEQIKASARRMEVLVSDLLALSSIGRVVSTFKDVSSLEVVKNVTSRLQDRLNENGMKLVVADNLPTIYCDGERIHQVFENLLVNAIKFVRGAENPMIEVGYDGREDLHQFYVRDNGIGVDPKYHRKIFDMFQRLKEIEDEEGTGLGLAIVDRIVNNHGGKVWVESEKGRGATFYFTLPKACL